MSSSLLVGSLDYRRTDQPDSIKTRRDEAHTTLETLEDAVADYPGETAEEALLWAYQRLGERLAVVTSFQVEGMVILDLVAQLGLGLRVITLDTGRLPQETHELIDRVRQRYDFDVEVVFPDASALQELVRSGGPNLFLDSVENRLACCRVRKVEPFRRAVAELGGWVSGIRREHGGSRADASPLEIDRGNRPEGDLLKVNPLVAWSEDQVWSYVHDNKVPYHALYDQGYRSIGCAPCTRPTRPAEDDRGGRWWWEQGAKECGLHLGPPPNGASPLVALGASSLGDAP